MRSTSKQRIVAPRLAGALTVLAALVSGSAFAEVKQVSAAGFELQHQVVLKAEASKVFQTLSQPAQWWHPSHTWSGDSANLSLELRAGGCFCKRWPEGEAEHMRVGAFQHNTQLRLIGGLGPLQAMGLGGALQFTLKPHEDGTELSLVYRVSGDNEHQLEPLAPVVDRVLGEQFTRLLRLIETGAAKAAESAAE